MKHSSTPGRGARASQMCCPRQHSERTNGALVRCFGRNHCSDGVMTLVLSSVLAVFALPVLVYQLAAAWCSRRKLSGRRGDCGFQLCSGLCCCRFCQRYHSSAWEIEDAAFKKSLRHQLVHVRGVGENQYAETKLHFVCLSDTHMQHDKIKVPDGDVLVHTGDFTNHGTLQQTIDFAEWFASQPHKIKICVPGNHDAIFDKHYWQNFWSDWSRPSRHETRSIEGSDGDLPDGLHVDAIEAFQSRGIHVLIDRALYLHIVPNGGGITVASEVKELNKQTMVIYGSPWVTRYASWQTGFNKSDEEMAEHWKRIVQDHRTQSSTNGSRVPEHIDLLLTHMPPKGIGDMEPGGARQGCPHLLKAVRELSPAVHVFGHVHSDMGTEILKANGGPRHATHCINAASVCDYYWVGSRSPMIFDLCPSIQTQTQSTSSVNMTGPSNVIVHANTAKKEV